MRDSVAEGLCKSRVQAVLSLMRPEWKWAAMNRSGYWHAFQDEPTKADGCWVWVYGQQSANLDAFDLPAFPGNWKDSLVKRR